MEEEQQRFYGFHQRRLLKRR